MEIVIKYAGYAGGVACWKMMRVLSRRAATNVFLEEGLKIISGRSESNVGKVRRKKLELFRELILAYIH